MKEQTYDKKNLLRPWNPNLKWKDVKAGLFLTQFSCNYIWNGRKCV